MEQVAAHTVGCRQRMWPIKRHRLPGCLMVAPALGRKRNNASPKVVLNYSAPVEVRRSVTRAATNILRLKYRPEGMKSIGDLRKLVVRCNKRLKFFSQFPGSPQCTDVLGITVPSRHKGRPTIYGKPSKNERLKTFAFIVPRLVGPLEPAPYQTDINLAQLQSLPESEPWRISLTPLPEKNDRDDRIRRTSGTELDVTKDLIVGARRPLPRKQRRE
jgi:hypothetical protein